MKWFKHECGERNEEFSSKLIDQFGLDGYARWSLLKEVVGENMDRYSDRHHISLSWTKWQSELRGKKTKLELFFKFLQDKGKISYILEGNILTISIPGLLQKRDEYSKKSKKGKRDSQFISDSFRKQTGNVSEMNRKQNQNISETKSCNSLQIKDNDKKMSGHTPDNVPPKKKEDYYLRNNLKKGEEEKNNSLPPPMKINLTKNQETTGDPYAGLNGHAMPVHWFLKFAERSHKKVKGFEIEFDSEKDIQRTLKLVDRVTDQKLLRLAWWEFLNLKNSWLDNPTQPKPRDLAIFSKFLNDCLPKATSLLKQTRERNPENSARISGNLARNSDLEEKSSEKYMGEPVQENDYKTWEKALVKIENEILSENYNTWFTPIRPIGRDGPKLLIAVPNQFFERCLTENYQELIEQTLNEVDSTLQSVEFILDQLEKVEM